MGEGFVDVAKIGLGVETATGAMRRPLELNQAGIGHDRQHLANDRLRDRLRRAAMLGIRAVLVFGPETMHHEAEVMRWITLAGRSIARVGGTEFRSPR